MAFNSKLDDEGRSSRASLIKDWAQHHQTSDIHLGV